MRRISLLILTLLVTTATMADEPRFFSDDPLLVDDDLLDIPVKPEEIELSDHYDRFSHLWHDFGSDEWGEAENVNTLDEVPDSSWFTNRHGRHRMSLEALVRGPNSGPGPVGAWRVFKTKAQGLTPGFQIIDEAGDRYVIKLDPNDWPEIASAAEVIGTKLFHAIGYHVPENHLARLDPDTLGIEPGAVIRDAFGDKIPLTHKRLGRLLRRAPRLDDGGIRVVASKYIDGVPLGPFRYHGTRSDDANDVVLHEQRRELRGLRLIAAWLNHDDTRSQNTQDAWVERDGRHFVRHYLIDFGSVLGSASVGPQLASGGVHYWMEHNEMWKQALGLGFVVPKYRKIAFRRDFPSIGRFESNAFDPASWKSDYPNPAFVRMTDRDAFWAAKIIMSFTPQEIRALVETGELSDKAAEEYLVKTLIERQRKCGVTYLNRLNPLDEFRTQDGALRFTNLAEAHGVGAPDASYHAQWSFIQGSERVSLGEASVSHERMIRLPRIDHTRNRILSVAIRTRHPQHPAWDRPVSVYLRPEEPAGYRIIGIERDADPTAHPP